MCYRGGSMNLKERNDENREFFNEKANGDYEEKHSEFMATKNMLIDNISVEPNKVIDLGAGTGLELIPFFDKYPNSKVVAIDLAIEMLNKIKEKPFSDKVEIICGDFFEVDFGSNIDAIISTSALHHFLYDDKKRLYKKVYDSLREGGEFVNCDYIASSNEAEEEFIYNYDNKVKRHNDTPLTIEHELEILNNIGFKEVIVKETDRDNYRLIKAIK